ncbi:hypothetical protein AALP_AA7G153800 [Arabis alpina]|uniref:Uncharacterized protein n=1 Tax=Arabis alpina TaxID=50452 RepID=A0A087GI85_ARAAL|nr:hypothetical protein AALP_AA7G153800 [Arabis alpina]
MTSGTDVTASSSGARVMIGPGCTDDLVLTSGTDFSASPASTEVPDVPIGNQTSSHGLDPSRFFDPTNPMLPFSTLPPAPSLTLDELAMRRGLSAEIVRISSGKGKGIDYETPLKRRRVNTYLAAVIEKEASASGVAVPPVSGLLRDEAYTATKIGEAVAEARDEMARSFLGRVTEEVIGIPDAANDISVAQTEQVSEVAGPSAIETIDVEGVVPEERAGNEDAE